MSTNSNEADSPTMSQQQPVPVWIDFVAGWAAGAVSVVCVQPVDTFLTRWQANHHSSSSSMHLRGWFRGASPMMASVPVQNALLMGGYGMGQQWFEEQKNTSGADTSRYEKWGAIFVGGCTGGILQSFLMSPVELVKVTQQLAPSGAAVSSVLQSLPTRQIVGCGLSATLLRDGIPHGVWFVAYDMCKTALTERQQQHSTATAHTIPMVSGAVAATVAWIVGYPFDLIKTRLQAVPHVQPNPSVYGMARHIVVTERGGIRGLYRGLGLKLVRSIPASMISFSVYEAVKDAMV